VAGVRIKCGGGAVGVFFAALAELNRRFGTERFWRQLRSHAKPPFNRRRGSGRVKDARSAPLRGDLGKAEVVLDPP